MINAKKALRREVLQGLKAASAADPAQLRSADLRKKLAFFLQGNQLCVGIYAPLPHEVNLLPLMQEYPLHRYVFPLCLPGRHLRFHQVQCVENDMEPGAMGILAPAAHTPAVEPQDIDILIVPGVAFTRRGERLGYGGGFYDRYIPLCTKAEIISLVFDEQLVEMLPTESHDWRIPVLITTTQVVRTH